MPGQISINFENTIESITVLDAYNAPLKDNSHVENQVNDLSVRNQEQEFSSACKALKTAAVKVDEFYEKIVAQRGEEIAKLSIEIARKILMQKIETKSYEIESIIKEALKNFSSNQDVVVHLHPEDYEQCQAVMDKDAGVIPPGVTLVADPNVGLAECIVKSPKGTVLSLINEQLEQIEAALKKTQ